MKTSISALVRALVRHHGMLIALGGLALVTAAAAQTTAPKAATPAAAQSCTLQYQRADNMWAAEGRPDGNLGVETITLQSGQRKTFITDWKYEKQRNDGRNYYGSHLRIATNIGKRPMNIQLRSLDVSIGPGPIAEVKGAFVSMLGTLVSPGTTQRVRADLVEIACDAPLNNVLMGSGSGSVRPFTLTDLLNLLDVKNSKNYCIQQNMAWSSQQPPGLMGRLQSLMVSTGATFTKVPLPPTAQPAPTGGVISAAKIPAFGSCVQCPPNTKVHTVEATCVSGTPSAAGRPGPSAPTGPKTKQK